MGGGGGKKMKGREEGGGKERKEEGGGGKEGGRGTLCRKAIKQGNPNKILPQVNILPFLFIFHEGKFYLISVILK